MKRTSMTALLAASCFAAMTAFAAGSEQAQGSSGAGATTEQSRTAGGVSDELMKDFQKLDADRDRYLTRKELSSQAELVASFDKADKDRDGKLDPAEYQVLIAETSIRG